MFFNNLEEVVKISQWTIVLVMRMMGH